MFLYPKALRVLRPNWYLPIYPHLFTISYLFEDSRRPIEVKNKYIWLLFFILALGTSISIFIFWAFTLETVIALYLTMLGNAAKVDKSDIKKVSNVN